MRGTRHHVADARNRAARQVMPRTAREHDAPMTGDITHNDVTTMSHDQFSLRLCAMSRGHDRQEQSEQKKGDRRGTNSLAAAKPRPGQASQHLLKEPCRLHAHGTAMNGTIAPQPLWRPDQMRLCGRDGEVQVSGACSRGKSGQRLGSRPVLPSERVCHHGVSSYGKGTASAGFSAARVRPGGVPGPRLQARRGKN